MTDSDDSREPTDNPDSQHHPQPPLPTTPSAPTPHEVSNDPNESTNSQGDTARELAREFRWVEFAQLAVNGVLAVIGIFALCIYHGQLKVMQGQLGEIIKQYPELQKSASSAKSAADTARDTLVLAQRPWIKIKHRIIQPLTFNVSGNGGLIDSMTVEDTLENVGTSVALNVLSWEDVIPIDPDHSLRTARNRQRQWCDANRHPSEQGLSGYMLFPKEPFVQPMHVGGYMKDVMAVARANKLLPGKVGFVLVGCVCYRSSFEPQSDPTHQTRFIYYLGEVQKWGGFLPDVLPLGTAANLRLIEMPDGFSAD
jgi:hypothetical protein